MTIQVPQRVQRLLRRLNAAGYQAYAVGGCVRDSLLGRMPQDWDICTSATPEETKTCFSHLRTVLTGERFGTVTVLQDGEAYEITTFRAETDYGDCRHPGQVTFLQDLRGDLSRRDFTINAMAADADGRVTDCFGGLTDLKQGVLRCVGRAEERFSEDALRMLRALRFSARFDFPLAPETATAVHQEKARLTQVAPERLRKELEGLLCGPAAARVLEEYADVLFLLIPELAPCRGFEQYNPNHIYDVWGHTLAVLAETEPVPALRLAALLHDVGKPGTFFLDKNLVGHFYGHAAAGAAMTERILRRLRFDNGTVQLVTALVAEHDCLLDVGTDKQLRRCLNRMGAERLRLVLRLRRADRLGTGRGNREAVETLTRMSEALLEEILRKKSCFSLAQLELKGADLIALGMEPGPRMGALLWQALTAVMDGRVENTREALQLFAQNAWLETEAD